MTIRENTIIRCFGIDGDKFDAHFDIDGTTIDTKPYTADVYDDSIVFSMPEGDATYRLMEQLAGTFSNRELRTSPINRIYLSYSSSVDKKHYWTIVTDKAFFRTFHHYDYGNGSKPYYGIEFETILPPKIYYHKAGESTDK